MAIPDRRFDPLADTALTTRWHPVNTGGRDRPIVSRGGDSPGIIRVQPSFVGLKGTDE